MKKKSIKPKLKKKGDGGTNSPIIVNDPHDPRLQAYQDSLSFYNRSKKELSSVGNSSKNTPIYVKSGVNPIIFKSSDYNFVNQRPIDTSRRYDNNMNPNNNFPPPSPPQTIMPIAGIGVNEGNSMGGWFDIYKRPSQPYQYKKQLDLPTLQPITNVTLPNNQEPLQEPTKIAPNYFTRGKQPQEKGPAIQYFNKATGKQLEFGGNIQTSNMKNNKGKLKIPTKLMKYGGMWDKSEKNAPIQNMRKFFGGGQTNKDGVVLNPQPFTNQIVGPYGNQYSETWDPTQDAHMTFGNPSSNGSVYPVNPNLNLNKPEGYNFNGNQQQDYGTGDNQPYSGNTTPYPMRVPFKKGVPAISQFDPNEGLDNQNPIYGPPSPSASGSQKKNSNKTKDGLDGANYNNPVTGHSGNYWADFATHAWGTIDALSHAVPDTLGDKKLDRATRVGEVNNMKMGQNPYLGVNANTGTGQQLKKFGGNVNDYKADGGNSMMPNVETEGKEHLQLPNGIIGQINGPSHAEGGVPMQLPTGTKVFSEKLKDPETGKSYSKLAKKLQTKKEQEILDSPDSDKIARETAQMQIAKKNADSDKLFAMQEANKLQGLHGKAVQESTIQDYQEQAPQAGNGSYVSTNMMPYLYSPMETGGLAGTKDPYFSQNMIPYLYSPQMYGGFLGDHNPASKVIPILESHATGGEINDKYYVYSPMANGGSLPMYDGKQAGVTGLKGDDEFGGDLNKVYDYLSSIGYSGPKEIGRMQQFTTAKNPVEVANYMERVQPNNKAREIWEKEFGQKTPMRASDWTKFTPEQKIRAFNDSLWDYRFPKTSESETKPSTVATTTTQPQGDAISNMETQGYNPSTKRGKLGMLPSVVGIPNPQLDAAVNFRNINPNLIDYRPESNIGEINDIQKATSALSRFLPTTAEGIGNAANMQANALGEIGKSYAGLYNANQRGKLGVDEANQRELTGVDEFNAKNFLEQANHITGREQLKNVQSQTDRKEALNQINTNNQFANTADFLGRTLNPSNYYGGNADLVIRDGDSEDVKQAKKTLLKYAPVPKGSKVVEKEQTKKNGGKIKPSSKDIKIVKKRK